MADPYVALENAVSSKSSDDIIKNLKIILSNANVEFINLTILKSLLKSDSNEIIRLVAQVIAECGKNSANREKLSDKELIESLLKILSTNKNILCLTQVCRALGNISYENDMARQIMNKNDGVKIIVDVLELSGKVDDCANMQLMKVNCGLLFNYLISNEDAQKEALKLKILSVIEKIVNVKLDYFATCEDLFVHLLHVLSVLSEQFVDTWLSNKFLSDIVKILELSINPEISEFCLELLQGQAENDDIKLLLAQNGLCELLYNLLEQHKSLVSDEESRALLKQACDLIVLILTGDQSMTLLYADGNGTVYKDMINWLHSDDIDLMITGVLAVGNFARNDKHCIKMVQDGLSETLINMLSKHNKLNDDIRLQHALLSALRNLTIPAQNKSKLISLGLVDIILPMLMSEQYPVIFKLLGTLRMAIDGQEKTAQQLIMKEDLLERLVNFYTNSDHPGVRAESPRLLAWLIKHSHTSEVYPKLIKVKDCIKCLIEMIPSSHGVMQNEALLALNILCAFENANKNKNAQNDKTELSNNIETLEISKENNLYQAFVEYDIGKFIAFLLNKYVDKMDKEIIENLIVFLDKICDSINIRENLKKNDVSTVFRKVLDRKELTHQFEKVNKISNSIDSG